MAKLDGWEACATPLVLVECRGGRAIIDDADPEECVS
jgi:hypothetical protein